MKSYFYSGLFTLYMQRQKELMDEAERYRMIKEAGLNVPITHKASRLLARISQDLLCVGKRLKERFSTHPESPPAFTQQGNPDGCA
jgi:hypothetical protein